MYNAIRSTERIAGEEVRLERREWFAPVSGKGRAYVWEILSGPGKGDFGGKCSTKAEARKDAGKMVRAYRREAEKAERLRSGALAYDIAHLRSLIGDAENPNLEGHAMARARERVAVKVTTIQKGSVRGQQANDSGEFLPMAEDLWEAYKTWAKELINS